MVESKWDTDGVGPAKRLYKVTRKGKTCWMLGPLLFGEPSTSWKGSSPNIDLEKINGGAMYVLLLQ